MTTDLTTDLLGRVRELIEDELAELRHFAGLPTAEVEQVAERLTRAIAPVIMPEEARRDAA